MSRSDAVNGVLDKLEALAQRRFRHGLFVAFLQRLPVETLKIDRSFIDALLENPESRELVRTLLTMAKNLQISVVAEGVKTEAQLEQLRTLHCE